ncbi:HD domain-containing protein [bacterium]|nr:HD domain-containing protein [bacterium]
MQEHTKQKIEEFINRLARAIQLSRIYGQDHGLSQEAVNELYLLLTSLLVQNGEITLGLFGDELAFDKEPLYELSERRKDFIEHLKSMGFKKINITGGIEKRELADFIQILGGKSKYLDDSKDIRAAVARAAIRHVTVGEIGLQKLRTPVKEETLDEKVKKNYETSLRFLTKTFQDLKGNQPLNVHSARQIVESLIKNLMQNKNLLLILTSIKGHDENTFMHGVNVSIFTLLQAEVLGIEKKYLVDMGLAAMLHDIGRLSIPASMVKEMEAGELKELAEEEEEKQAQMDIKGAKILLETEGINVLSAIAAYEHNMRYDMTGYQRKLYGKKLNLVSMLIAISDYYDKLRRQPSYYQEGGPEKAYEEMMKKSGTVFHPDLLQNFFSVMGVYPPGTLVELDTKEVALVIQSSMLDKKRPQVEILYDSDGEKYKEPRIFNLVEKDKRGHYKKSIVKSISFVNKFKVPEKYS